MSLTFLFFKRAALALARICDGQEFFVNAKAIRIRKKASRRLGGFFGACFLHAEIKRMKNQVLMAFLGNFRSRRMNK